MKTFDLIYELSLVDNTQVRVVHRQRAPSQYPRNGTIANIALDLILKEPESDHVAVK